MSELATLTALLREVLGLKADTPLTAETALLGSLPEFDSMAVLSVLTRLEEHYGISIADDDISAEIFETVGSLLAFVQARLAA